MANELIVGCTDITTCSVDELVELLNDINEVISMYEELILPGLRQKNDMESLQKGIEALDEKRYQRILIQGQIQKTDNTYFTRTLQLNTQI